VITIVIGSGFNKISGSINVHLTHGKRPQKCMKTATAPICKNKNGDVNHGGNYRPVSLARTIFNYVTLPIILRYIVFLPLMTTRLAATTWD